MPPLARTTHLPRPTAAPRRGAKLFLSVRKDFEELKGELLLAAGGLKTS